MFIFFYKHSCIATITANITISDPSAPFFLLFLNQGLHWSLFWLLREHTILHVPQYFPTEKLTEQKHEHLHTPYLSLPPLTCCSCFALLIWACSLLLLLCPHVLFSQPFETVWQVSWPFTSKYTSVYLLVIKMFSYKTTSLWPSGSLTSIQYLPDNLLIFRCLHLSSNILKAFSSFFRSRTQSRITLCIYFSATLVSFHIAEYPPTFLFLLLLTYIERAQAICFV